jgi:endonuclease YncB( thermonuclease family)
MWCSLALLALLLGQTDALQQVDAYDPLASPPTLETGSGIPSTTRGLTSRAEKSTWDILEGCRFKKEAYHDGDSFHVMHEGHEYIFRIYHVDAPEVDKEFPERVKEQARYFKVTQAELMGVAGAAARFTERQLSTPFRVLTRWQDARGASQLPRYYGCVFLEGTTLAEKLVEQGLARIHGTPADIPGYKVNEVFMQSLSNLEALARRELRGAWAYASLPKKVKPKQ